MKYLCVYIVIADENIYVFEDHYAAIVFITNEICNDDNALTDYLQYVENLAREEPLKRPLGFHDYIYQIVTNDTSPYINSNYYGYKLITKVVLTEKDI